MKIINILIKILKIFFKIIFSIIFLHIVLITAIDSKTYDKIIIFNNLNQIITDGKVVSIKYEETDNMAHHPYVYDGTPCRCRYYIAKDSNNQFYNIECYDDTNVANIYKFNDKYFNYIYKSSSYFDLFRFGLFDNCHIKDTVEIVADIKSLSEEEKLEMANDITFRLQQETLHFKKDFIKILGFNNKIEVDFVYDNNKTFEENLKNNIEIINDEKDK